MHDPFKIPLEKLRITIERIKPQLVHALGVEALLFIDDNFAKQGFQGATFQKWPDRKKKEKGAQRAILVGKGSGVLRRSFIQTDHADHTIISTDVPYARIHNEGGDIVHKSHKGLLNNLVTGGKLNIVKQTSGTQKRRIRQVRRGYLGDVTHMPKRQFIGPSPVLTQRCQLSLVRIIKNNIK